MLEARAHRHPAAGKQRKLRRMAREPFERGKAIHRRELADRVHAGIEIERRKARSGIADFGNAQPDLIPHLGERIGSHCVFPSWFNEGSPKCVNEWLHPSVRLTESPAFAMERAARAATGRFSFFK